MTAETKASSSSRDTPHKIVVEAETVAVEPQALAFATRMAEPIGARLVGCFVENQALMDLTELPFASEVSASGTVRPLERERLINEWQGQAKQAENALAAAALSAGIDWEFEVRRGKPIFSMLEVVEREDIIVLNAVGRLTAASDVTRAVRAATNDIRADVLLTGRAPQKTGTAWAAPNTTLVVLDDLTSRGEACCLAAEALALKAGMNCIPLRPQSLDLQEVADLVRRLSPSLVIADSASKLFAKDDDVTKFSKAAGCPLFLLGSERELTGPNVSTDPIP